jgi:hypothetical protein
VNFFRSGGGCSNTGEIAAVFDHEWGHGLDNNDGIPTVSSPGEGIADVTITITPGEGRVSEVRLTMPPDRYAQVTGDGEIARDGDTVTWNPQKDRPQSLHYTANRWLVLVITFIVTARVLFGVYRSILFAGGSLSATSAISAFGIPQSLAAGAIVIGYYLAYTAGLRWRIRVWQRRSLRRM